MPKAYSYIRMSTPEQRQGHSTERQYEATKAYADTHGLILEDIILDEGVSAFRGQNADIGKLSEFIRAVEDGRVEQGSYLIVESLDRITRQNMFKAMALLDHIIESGVTLVTLQDNQTYSRATKAENSANIMFAVVTMLRAHEESKIKSERLSAVWGRKKRDAGKGKLTGQRLPLWLRYNSDKTAIEVIEERAELVKAIFELSRDGWGSYSICRKLNEDGVKTWNAKTRYWQESYLKKLLSNRAVLGEYQPHRKTMAEGKWRRIPDGEVVLDYYPSIISNLLFDQAHQAIQARKITGKGRKGNVLSNLFSGLLKCGNCGAGMRFIDKGVPPKGGTYLKCSASALKGGCKTQALRYDLVEESLLTTIEDLDLEFLLHGERHDKKRVEKQTQLSEIENELRVIEGRLGKLADALEHTSEPVPLLADRIMVAQREKEENTRRKEVIERQLAELGAISPATQKARLEALFAQLKDGSDQSDIEGFRRSISSEIRRIIRWIKIKQITRVPHEYRIDETLWPKASELSDEELDELCLTYPFEFALGYVNGDVQTFDPLTQEGLRFREDPRLRLMKRRRELARIGEDDT